MSKPRLPAVARSTSWRCPICHRRFARLRQWHSCQSRSVDAHFADRDPALRRLFDFLIGRLEKTGPVRIDAVKSSINLVSRHHFGAVTVRSAYLRLGFVASTRIQSPRIVRNETLGPNRVGHSVVVRDKADIDAELLRWLSDAQHLQS
jgi:hypothetical protein